jgi:putative membrane protein
MIGDADSAEGDGFRYLHPLSVLFEFSRTVRSNLIPTVAAILSARNGGWIGTSIGSTIISIGLAIAMIRYFTFRYRIQNRELVIHQGLFGRTNRTVPVDRIQNIDLSQNLFHRLFRVGEVRIETASGKEPEAVMRVLSLSEYGSLKESVIASREAAYVPVAMRVDSNDSEPNPDNDREEKTNEQDHEEKTILTLSSSLVMLAGLLSNRGEVLAGLLLGLLWQWRVGSDFIPSPWSGFAPTRSDSREMAKTISDDSTSIRGYLASLNEQLGPIATVVALLVCFAAFILVLRVFSALWYLTKFYGYRLESKGDSLHVRCGLFTQISATIPRKHVQLISVQRNWLAKKFGLASIRIETAGGDSKSEDSASSVGRRWFIPVIRYDEVPRILDELDSRIEFDESKLNWHSVSPRAFQRRIRPVLLIAAVLIAIGVYFIPIWGWSFGLVTAIVGWIYVKAKSASRSYARTSWGVLYRSGLRVKRCSMTTWEKVQSAKFVESPFDRRWKMASLHIDTAFAGPASHTLDIEMLDKEVADQELRQIRAIMEIK